MVNFAGGATLKCHIQDEGANAAGNVALVETRLSHGLFLHLFIKPGLEENGDIWH